MGVTIKTLKDIQTISNNTIAIVAYVCGTDKDHQGLASSEQKLKDIGVMVAKTNAQAALMAAELGKGVA